MFSDQQEMDVGDAIAEQVQRNFLVIDDDDYTGYVQRVGEKLLAQGPPTTLKVRFLLFDLPVANAITLPGGRIYVSRKLIALTRNEDELAGVLGHELGHLLTHQSAIRLSVLFREALGVTQPGSRETLFEQYEQLQDNLVKKRKAFQHLGIEGQQDQLIADQIGLQLVANAGYSTQAFTDFFDRLAETKGKTGSWFSDLFGATRPESRRLREMVKSTLAKPCARILSPRPEQDFHNWQSSVIGYSGLGHKERIPGVLSKTSLDPPLQSDILQVRFSPDGRYLLTQNDSTIFVVNREPLSNKFSIYAPDAYPAEFSADSESISFYTPSLRIETWSVSEEARVSVRELSRKSGCWQTKLSPGGETLACYGGEGNLTLYDVASGETKFEKIKFYEPDVGTYFFLFFARMRGQTNVPILEMNFSPDSRYFVAHAPNNSVLALETEKFQSVLLPGSIKKLLALHFAFAGPDKIVGVNADHPKESALVTFPGGELVNAMELGGQLESAGDPRYLILRPIKDYAAGVMDLETGKGVMASKRSSVDVFGDVYAREREDGELALYELKSGKGVAHLKLPLGKLGHLSASSVSPDLQWLAISEKSRGGVWDVPRGQRVFHVRGFNAAWVSPDGKAMADFAKHDQDERQIGVLNVVSRQTLKGMGLGEAHALQFGSIVLRRTRKDPKDWRSRNELIEALDALSGSVLWSRAFSKEAPAVLSHRAESNLVFAWPASSDGAAQEIAGNPELNRRWPKADATFEDYFIESVDPRTGKLQGAVIARTGKGAFRILGAESDGSWLAATDTNNRVLIYSLLTGERTGIVFGNRPVISAATALLAVQNDRGELSLYDLNTVARREEYVFKSPIAYTAFGTDHRRFLVLTGEQLAYTLELPKPASVLASH